MFELLLQADKAMADGLLDQAERTYWQLIELDPTNAIAVSSLARISYARGDHRLARTFAQRAVSIDPQNVAARRVLEALDHGDEGSVEIASGNLPMIAAERLEALSRRPGMRSRAESGDSAAEDAAGAAGEEKPASARKRRAVESEPDRTQAAGEASTDAAAGTQSNPDPPAAVGKHKPRRGPQPGVRPDQVSPMPPEPLKERRQAGRLAAAAAAAAAAAMQQPTHRAGQSEPRRAMPWGGRHFVEDELRPATKDAFDFAETAAAVEAVDALDVADGAPEAVVDSDAEAQDMVEAEPSIEIDAEDSVALRIALLADAEEAETDETSAEEAAAAEASIALRISLVADAAELEEARRGLANAESSAAIEAVDAAEEAEAQEAEAVADAEFQAELAAADVEYEHDEEALSRAESEAATTALKTPESGTHVGEARSDEAAPDEAGPIDARPIAREPLPEGGDVDEPSEEDAESEALREALAIVLGAEGEAGAGVSGKRNDALETLPALSVASTTPESTAPNPDAASEPAGDVGSSADADSAESAAGPEPEIPDQRPKKGFFRRFGGN